MQAVPSQRGETQQFERSKNHISAGDQIGGTPAMSNLEKNKQYLEKLRQLASIRNQKKQAASIMQQPSSIKSKKSNTGKAAMVHSEQISPNSKVNLQKAGQVNSFNARSSIPKLPTCSETRGVVSALNGQISKDQ